MLTGRGVAKIHPEKLIRGILFSEIPVHQDERGALVALDRNQSLPFEVKRCFFIWGCPPLAVRAGHSISADIGLLALRGSVIIDLDNAADKLTVELSGPQHLLCIHAGVWLRLRAFSADALIAVAASSLYFETKYFEAPQPDLLPCAGSWPTS
jgi:hypothetical protein